MHQRLIFGVSHFFLQSNLAITATLRTEESGRCGEVAVMGRKGCNMTIFLESLGCFFVLTVSHNLIMVIQSFIRYRDKTHKKLELCRE